MNAHEITVTAHKWEHGWELILNEDDITQVNNLDRAAEQVRDYLDTVYPHVDHSDVKVHLTLDDQEINERINEIHHLRETAQKTETQAARKIREVVAQLRGSRGLSIREAAAILEVSPSRVSQLSQPRNTKAKKSGERDAATPVEKRQPINA